MATSYLKDDEKVDHKLPFPGPPSYNQHHPGHIWCQVDLEPGNAPDQEHQWTDQSQYVTQPGNL